jgi:hypothetical protein
LNSALEGTLEFFNEHSLTPQDLVYFIKIQNDFQDLFGSKHCWCLKSALKFLVQGFSTSHSTRPLFKGTDARPLALSVVGQYQTETKLMVVRRHQCRSIYCINPNHFYWGTKQDVCFERGWRKKSKVTPELVQELRSKYESEKISFTSLAKSYKLPYHVVRNICRYISYV